MKQRCCGAMRLEWRQMQVADRWADVQVCASCEHIHVMESWPAPISFDPVTSCVNCGGYRPPGTHDRCNGCGLDEAADLRLHRRLQPDPSLSFGESGRVARGTGRVILALKMATAEVRWGQQPEESLYARLEALEALGQLPQALDEAIRWANHGGPPELFATIAGLQVTGGDLEAAIQSLRYGLRQDPENGPLWADYAELLAHLGDLALALEAAARTLPDPVARNRGLAIIRDAANRYFTKGQFEDAVAAASYAGELQARFGDLAWIRCQVASFNADNDEAVRWAHTVLTLDPDHAEASSLVERLAPKRKSWLW